MVDGKIYAIGGHTDGGWDNIVSAVEEYDPATDTWTEKADMPVKTGSLSTNVVNDRIYAIGGVTPEGWTSAVYEYNPKTDRWTEKTAMSFARAVLSTSTVNGKIYAIGGCTVAGTALSTVEEYDPEFTGKTITSKGKLATSWGKLKATRRGHQYPR